MKERIKHEHSSLLLFPDMTIFFFLFLNTNVKFTQFERKDLALTKEKAIVNGASASNANV